MQFRYQALIALGIGLVASCLPILATQPERTAHRPVPAAAIPSGRQSPLGPVLIGPLPYDNRAILDMTGSSALDLNMENYRVGPFEAWDFAPTFIQGTPGRTMTLVLRNASPVTHSFTLEAQNITRDVAPGTIDLVEVTIPSSGGVLFYCRFHSDKGMNGQLLAGRIPPQPLPKPAPTAAPPR